MILNVLRCGEGEIYCFPIRRKVGKDIHHGARWNVPRARRRIQCLHLRLTSIPGCYLRRGRFNDAILMFQ